MTSFILVDGKRAAAVHALDRGLQFGDGLFETMAVVDGRIRLRARHLARLLQDCQRLLIEPPKQELLLDELDEAARRLSHGVLKLIITRGSGQRGYKLPVHPISRRVLIASPWPDLPQQMRLMVCKTVLASGGSLAGIKHLNRLEQVLATAEWEQVENVNEGLMLDPNGNAIEATSANLFIVRNGTVQTPKLDGCGVSGVMRSLVLDTINATGSTCEIKNISVKDVLTADEVFLTNSVSGIRPVVALDEQHWLPGQLTGELSGHLNEILSRHADKDAH